MAFFVPRLVALEHGNETTANHPLYNSAVNYGKGADLQDLDSRNDPGVVLSRELKCMVDVVKCCDAELISTQVANDAVGHSKISDCLH